MPCLVIADAPVLPSGMDKLGDQTISGDTTNVQLTGWTPRVGYTDTTIVADAVALSRAGQYVLDCRITVSEAWNDTFGGLQIQVMHNNTALASADFANGATTHTINSVPAALVPSDRVWVRMTNTNGGFGASATVVGGTNTFLTVEAR